MARQSKMAQQPTDNRIPSGYDGTAVPTDFFMPSCGIEDVDIALFNLFDKDNFIQININDEEGNFSYKHKVPVVFASGERFVLRQKSKPFRDKNGSLILPIISIKRISLSQEKTYLGGMGIGQNVGDFTIKRKLSPEDRNWQNIINKLSIDNQDNVSSVSNFLNSILKTGSIPGEVASRREGFDKKNDKMLSDDLGNNIYEIITMPFPVFYHLTYEVEIWTSYRQQMNEIIEKIMTNYDGQGRTYVLNTNKGYWFVSYFDDDIGSDENTEEFTDQSRIFKTKFNINVPAYMIANKNGGDMVPFRRYLSAAQLSFDIMDGIYENPFVSKVPEGKSDKFTLNDVNELDSAGNKVLSRDERAYKRILVKDPFSGKDKEEYLEVKYSNARSGETILKKKILTGINIP